jgi:hypothetical protein
MRKNKNNYLLLSGFLIAVAICGSANSARATNDHLIISEVLTGSSSADEEFIELYNPTSSDIDLKTLPIKLHTISSTGTDTSKTLIYTTSNSIIKSHEYFLLASTAYKNSHGETFIGITYSPSLVSNGAVYISASATKNSDIIDLVCWGKSTKCDFPLPDPKSNYSLERIENDSDWQESCETGGTPEKEGKECPAEPISPATEAAISPAESDPIKDTSASTDENYQIPDKIYLNEIFPNPKKDSSEEYIEIKNESGESVDLYRWTLRDGSKTGKYIFKNHTIVEPGKYFAIYKSQSKLSLNNSSETVYLYDPRNNLASNISYDKSQKDASYNFNGEEWRWSKYLTPNKKNKFDSEPVMKTSKPNDVYENIPAEFSVKAKDKETKKLKYAWDFGDGGKSYLKKTTHKFLETGKYTVTLSVRDESQAVEKSFKIEVKKYPRPDLEIIKIIPNPAGADTDGEIIEIKNNSKKEVNLEN